MDEAHIASGSSVHWLRERRRRVKRRINQKIRPIEKWSSKILCILYMSRPHPQLFLVCSSSSCPFFLFSFFLYFTYFFSKKVTCVNGQSDTWLSLYDLRSRIGLLIIVVMWVLTVCYECAGMLAFLSCKSSLVIKEGESVVREKEREREREREREDRVNSVSLWFMAWDTLFSLEVSSTVVFPLSVI